MKPHLRLRYLTEGVWFVDVYARRGDAVPLMFTRFAPGAATAVREAWCRWCVWQTVTSYA